MFEETVNSDSQKHKESEEERDISGKGSASTDASLHPGSENLSGRTTDLDGLLLNRAPSDNSTVETLALLRHSESSAFSIKSNSSKSSLPSNSDGSEKHTNSSEAETEKYFVQEPGTVRQLFSNSPSPVPNGAGEHTSAEDSTFLHAQTSDDHTPETNPTSLEKTKKMKLRENPGNFFKLAVLDFFFDNIEKNVFSPGNTEHNININLYGPFTEKDLPGISAFRRLWLGERLSDKPWKELNALQKTWRIFQRIGRTVANTFGILFVLSFRTLEFGLCALRQSLGNSKPILDSDSLKNKAGKYATNFLLGSTKALLWTTEKIVSLCFIATRATICPVQSYEQAKKNDETHYQRIDIARRRVKAAKTNGQPLALKEKLISYGPKIPFYRTASILTTTVSWIMLSPYVISGIGAALGGMGLGVLAYGVGYVGSYLSTALTRGNSILTATQSAQSAATMATKIAPNIGFASSVATVAVALSRNTPPKPEAVDSRPISTPSSGDFPLESPPPGHSVRLGSDATTPYTDERKKPVNNDLEDLYTSSTPTEYSPLLGMS